VGIKKLTQEKFKVRKHAHFYINSVFIGTRKDNIYKNLSYNSDHYFLQVWLDFTNNFLEQLKNCLQNVKIFSLFNRV